MDKLLKGKFFGDSKQQYKIEGITVVNSSFYQFSSCPWHYHQNAHFAFTTRGTLTETHRNKKYSLYPGCLIYNHSQEPHYNDHYSEKVAALHIDINDQWFQSNNIKNSSINGVRMVDNPLIKEIVFKIFKEVNGFDTASPLAIESMLVQAINLMFPSQKQERTKDVAWVKKLKDLLHSTCHEKLMLYSMASELGIHPVYLCQQFPLLFNCSFGEYIRKLRIEKAIGFILGRTNMSLTEIAYQCGFADQSHFTRIFKATIGVTPLGFKKYLRN